jgi:hypothetical protein
MKKPDLLDTKRSLTEFTLSVEQSLYKERLRDEFAKIALEKLKIGGYTVPCSIANDAYNIADAMMMRKREQ